MAWELLLTISIISGSLAVLFRRALMKDHKSDPYLYSMISQFVVAVLIFIYTAFTTLSIPNLLDYKLFLGIMLVVYTLGSISLFNAFKYADAAVVRILNGTRLIWILLGAYIFLNENVTYLHLIGTVCILTSLVILSIGKKYSIQRQGIVFGLLAAFFYGMGFINDANLAKDWHIPSLMLLEFSSVSIFMALIRPKKLLKIKSLMKRDVMLNMLIGGICYGVTSITIFLAYQQGGDASVIGPLGQTSTLVVVFLAAVFLGEREHIRKKLLAALFTMIGVVLLV